MHKRPPAGAAEELESPVVIDANGRASPGLDQDFGPDTEAPDWKL